MSLKVLLVEDSATKAKRNRTILELAGFAVTHAADGEEALESARGERPDAIVSDVQMPKMDGFQLTRAIRLERELSNVPILLLTEAFPDPEDEDLGLEAGADAYIRTREAGPVTLVATVREAVARRLNRDSAQTTFADEESFHRHHAERLRGHLITKVDELRDAYHALSIAYDHTLEAFVGALDLRESGTALHSWRVSEYSLTLARRLGVDSDALTDLERGALLHDIGKIGVPDNILQKRGQLDDDEWAIIRGHPEMGHRLLEGVEFLRSALDIVLYHHERWDGDGYPRGLRGAEIPLGARIFAVAEAIDAMTNERPYRSAVPFATALDEIAAGSGKAFDPDVAQAALSVSVDQWENIKRHVEEQRSGNNRTKQTKGSPAVMWSEQ